MRLPIRRAQRGFTLLEVLVAVIVLALVMFAIVSAGARYGDSASYLRERTLALWVARNRMAEIDLAPVYPVVGRSNDTVDMGGQRWRWQAEVKTTPDENLRRVDISVYKDSDREGRNAYASLSGFIARLGRQTTQ